MKTLLVIGAGIGQSHLIEQARARGLWVIVVSPLGNYPGLALADEICSLDIYDRDAIVDYARQKGVDAVVSDQNDLVMPTVAYVAEKLGLPGNSFDQAIAYSNKNVFREHCDKLGIPVPCHASSDKMNPLPELSGVPFPWIVKPEDSQSSIGVAKVSNETELESALEQAQRLSKNNRAIVEKFFVGHEVVCEGYIYQGKYHLLAFADRRYFDIPNRFIPTQTVFPSVVRRNILEQIVDYETQMAAHIRPNFGIVHSEYLINLESGEIRVVESALRGGGVFISSHLIPLATGIDVDRLLLDCALGEEVNVEEIFTGGRLRAAAYICFYLPEGEIVAVHGMEELARLPFVKKMEIGDLQVGMLTGKMLHKGMRKGPILVDAETREDLENYLVIIRDTLQIEVRAPDGSLKGICWS